MTRVGGGDEDIETQSLKYEAHTYKRVFSHLYMYYIILVSKGKFIWYDKGGRDEDIEGGLRKIFDTWKGGSEKIVGLGGGSENLYTLKPTGGGQGLLKNWTTSEGGC